MRSPFFHGVGGVVSADIAVPEHERELSFYSAVLTTGDSPLWREDLSNNLGTPVIGLGIRTPEYESLPLQWMPHFQVADVGRSVASAVELGGEEFWHSKTDDGEIQWAALYDPAGAAFGLIPAVSSDSEAHLNGGVGRISWLSLRVPDASMIQDFYKQVIGWSSKSIEFGSELASKRFEMQIGNDCTVAEIGEIDSNQNGIPSVWLIHLPVDDFPVSLRRVSEGGGKIIKEPGDSDYAVVCDPVGVYFALQSGK